MAARASLSSKTFPATILSASSSPAKSPEKRAPKLRCAKIFFIVTPRPGFISADMRSPAPAARKAAQSNAIRFGTTTRSFGATAQSSSASARASARSGTISSIGEQPTDSSRFLSPRRKTSLTPLPGIFIYPPPERMPPAGNGTPPNGRALRLGSPPPVRMQLPFSPTRDSARLERRPICPSSPIPRRWTWASPPLPRPTAAGISRAAVSRIGPRVDLGAGELSPLAGWRLRCFGADETQPSAADTADPTMTVLTISSNTLLLPPPGTLPAGR